MWGNHPRKAIITSNDQGGGGMKNRISPLGGVGGTINRGGMYGRKNKQRSSKKRAIRQKFAWGGMVDSGDKKKCHVEYKGGGSGGWGKARRRVTNRRQMAVRGQKRGPMKRQGETGSHGAGGEGRGAQAPYHWGEFAKKRKCGFPNQKRGKGGKYGGNPGQPD